MLRSLDQLRNGLVAPKCFQRDVTLFRIFDLDLSKHTIIRPYHTAGITALDLERIDGRYLLSGAKNGDLAIHDLLNTSGKISYSAEVVCGIDSGSQYAHKFSIVNVQWYPFDTGLFITTGMDKKLKIWDSNVMKPADSISLEYKITDHNISTISTQHSLIAVGLENPHVVLLDPRSGSRCHELRAHKTGVASVRWSPCSEYLLATGGMDNKIFFWDIRSAKGYLRTLDQHNGEAVGSRKDLITAHNGSINCIRFTDDGLHMVSHGTDSRLRLWDVALCKNTLVNYGSMQKIHSRYRVSFDMCCDSSLPILFVPCNSNVYIYDLFSGRRLKDLIGHFGLVADCVFRPSTHELYSCANDMTILVWTPDGDKELEEEESLSRRTGRGVADSVDSDNWSADEG